LDSAVEWSGHKAKRAGDMPIAKKGRANNCESLSQYN